MRFKIQIVIDDDDRQETLEEIVTLDKLIKVVATFRDYIQRCAGLIPNYGERWRSGERISSSFVESSVNVVLNKRFCKKQQMQWTPKGAHLLLQTRVAVLNEDLEGRFRTWYPTFRRAPKEEVKLAA